MCCNNTMFVMGSLQRSLILKHIEQCFEPLSVHRLEVVKNRIQNVAGKIVSEGRKGTSDNRPFPFNRSFC
jgi:hypothetical protein